MIMKNTRAPISSLLFNILKRAIDSTNNNLPCSAQTSGHGSVFDFSGNVVSGPATSSLTQYNASLSGTIITIIAS